MVTIYLCFLAGGAVLPFLNILLGSLSGGSDADIDMDADLDVGADLGDGIDLEAGSDPLSGASDLDVGSALSIGLLPTSLMSLSALAITFGAVGSVMTLTGSGKLLTFVVAAIAGYITAVVVQT